MFVDTSVIVAILLDENDGRALSAKLEAGTGRLTSSAVRLETCMVLAGRRVPIPSVIPETDEEKRRYEEAQQRREYRLAMREKALQNRV